MKTLPKTSLSLEHLKREAALLRRRHAQADAEICAELRHFEFSFADFADAEILAAPFALNDAQRITARQYGFSSWQKLKSYVQHSSSSYNAALAHKLVDAERAFEEEWTHLRSARTTRFDHRILRLHQETAELVTNCIEDEGWLDAGVAGHEGSEAAFKLVANSYTQGPLNQRVIKLMEKSVEDGRGAARGLGMLQDRALFLGGNPVIYGSTGDFDEEGRLTIGNNVVDPDNLNRRRALAGFDAIEKDRQRIIETYAGQDSLLRPDPEQYAADRQELAAVGNW